jgi:Domain of unknown function (DUF4149)
MVGSACRRLLAALWGGSLLTTGYLVAPSLFAFLADRSLAGMLAGRIFRIEAWLSLLCGVLLLGLIGSGKWNEEPWRKSCLLLTAAMLICTLIGYFGLQPLMAALREAAGGAALAGEAKARFALLHGISSAIYLLQSGLAIALIVRIR